MVPTSSLKAKSAVDNVSQVSAQCLHYCDMANSVDFCIVGALVKDLVMMALMLVV
ncbi:hypothetical protein DEO72_LG5g22 [Vigna unguiculata]|uniref:Uncharacterized protein n=1 Tax=Vigna unguiculata TaxID=3917 RepID=A0A4D6LVD7_VIGUN|nr:hypothetical protein DEO72_LG5g22 [Vigna unguiculata]